MAEREIIPILGSSGAGKSKLANNVITRLGTQGWSISEIHVGGLLREHGLDQPGGMTPDEAVKALMEAELERLSESRLVLLNGFPRTIQQADDFIKITQAAERRVPVIFQLKVSPEEARKRILKRSHDKHGRTFTNEEAESRVDYYRRHGQHVVDVLAAEYGNQVLCRLDTEHDRPEVNAHFAVRRIQTHAPQIFAD